ncbi:olfactory receptor 10A7-like [Antechinus flavipes]|uniref:olfactory receptor 10A7-like n=1 Tax=Antechinus flavipes TaxID=38775 RepID=UPI0022367FB4|nr:olfactory receptor 10A7-like [Antechinus flavipes]
MAHAEKGNHTSISKFILLGFENLHSLRFLLFGIILAVYLVTMMGNVLIITVVFSSRQLQTPMYYFLSNFSFLEICYTASVVPKMLKTVLSGHETISFAGCVTQFYFFGSMAATECFLLASMSYDRYLAICNPLRYPTLMTFHVCIQLAFGSWIMGFMAPIISVSLTFRLPFCTANEINHFFCDLNPIIKLACTDTHMVEMTIFITMYLVVVGPFTWTVISYSQIVRTILKISSMTGRKKAFSTCSSHLTVVTLYYGTLGVVYGSPSSNLSADMNKLFSMLYTVFTPMLNPIIYTLRNKDVKAALRKLIQ